MPACAAVRLALKARCESRCLQSCYALDVTVASNNPTDTTHR